MNTHKNDLSRMSARQLRARRRALAARLGDVQHVLAGSLTEMKQLGFALAFGVLLDTFVVRPILVPAFLILLHSGRLHLPRGTGQGPTPREEARPPQARVS